MTEYFRNDDKPVGISFLNPGQYIPTIREFTTKAVAYLHLYIKQNGSLTEDNITFTKEVMVQLVYVEMLLSRIERTNGLMLSSQYTFKVFLDQIVQAFSPYIEGRGITTISLTSLEDVNCNIERIIEDLRTPYEEEVIRPSLIEVIWNKIKDLFVSVDLLPHARKFINNNSFQFITKQEKFDYRNVPRKVIGNNR